MTIWNIKPVIQGDSRFVLSKLLLSPCFVPVLIEKKECLFLDGAISVFFDSVRKSYLFALAITNLLVTLLLVCY